MRRLLYLAALSMVVMLLFAPTALAQGAEQCPVGTNLTESGECVPQDDRCPPGQVFYEGAGSASGSCVPGDLIPGTASPAAPTATAEQYAPTAVAEQYTPATSPLPSTGGPALLLPAAGLLLATGLVGIKLVRRRS